MQVKISQSDDHDTYAGMAMPTVILSGDHHASSALPSCVNHASFISRDVHAVISHQSNAVLSILQ